MSLDASLPFSAVIPVRNEEADVQELARRLQKALPEGLEIIFVDDGSTDRTWERLTEIASPGVVRLIRFRRNFGKAAALMAGFQKARGEVVFTLDGDLQDDPAEIPRFLEKLEEGFDLVSGFKKRRHDPATKVIASRIFNFVVRKLTRLNLHDMNCGFKCYRGEVAREVRIWGELHRFIPAMAAWEGRRVGEIEVRHHARRHGRSKYGISRLFKGFVDLITVMLLTQYRERPAHGFGWVALLAAVLSGLAALGAVAAATTPYDVQWGARFYPLALLSWALGLKSVFFALTAVILMSAGWVAEVVISQPLRDRPAKQYAIAEQLD